MHHMGAVLGGDAMFCTAHRLFQNISSKKLAETLSPVHPLKDKTYTDPVLCLDGNESISFQIQLILKYIYKFIQLLII